MFVYQPSLRERLIGGLYSDCGRHQVPDYLLSRACLCPFSIYVMVRRRLEIVNINLTRYLLHDQMVDE